MKIDLYLLEACVNYKWPSPKRWHRLIHQVMVFDEIDSHLRQRSGIVDTLKEKKSICIKDEVIIFDN